MRPILWPIYSIIRKLYALEIDRKFKDLQLISNVKKLCLMENQSQSLNLQPILRPIFNCRSNIHYRKIGRKFEIDLFNKQEILHFRILVANSNSISQNISHLQPILRPKNRLQIQKLKHKIFQIITILQLFFFSLTYILSP